MATQTPDSIGAVLTDALADIYTCPASTKSTVQMIQISNHSTSASVDATVEWTDASNGNAAIELLSGSAIPAKAGQSALTGPLHLSAGDKIRAKGSAASQLHITVAYVEVA